MSLVVWLYDCVCGCAPSGASVLVSASVERLSVSRMREVLRDFFSFFFKNIFKRFLAFENQPTVNSGELAGGGSVAVALGVSDMLKVR